jgi:hypothetical protein
MSAKYLFVIAFGASDADRRVKSPWQRIGEDWDIDRHAATSARSPALAINQSVACCALLAAVKIARESVRSTFSQD